MSVRYIVDVLETNIAREYRGVTQLFARVLLECGHVSLRKRINQRVTCQACLKVERENKIGTDEHGQFVFGFNV